MMGSRNGESGGVAAGDWETWEVARQGQDSRYDRSLEVSSSGWWGT